MRRLGSWPVAAGLLVLAVLGLAACKRGKESDAGTSAVVATAAVPQSVIAMNDPAVAGQIKSGIYGVESGSWRWTAQRFSVALKPPAGSAQNGATLHFKFTIPDVVIDKVGPITLSASIGGVALMPQKYTKAGNYDYARDVSASAFGDSLAVVDFATDKALAPTNGEMRQLALIASSASLESH